jgi:MSHA pilin protein MshD
MSSPTSRSHAGMSLIEVVVFIVVLGIGIAGTVVLYSQVTRASVDPMIRKQALALASSMLEEVELKAFTYCDPDGATVYTAANAAACATQEVIGPNEPSANAETRYADPRFDNVNDYNGFSMGSGQVNPDIKTAANTPIAELANYSMSVSVANAGADFGLAAEEVLRITATATHAPTNTSVSLQGYRFRYAPNSP